MADNSRIMYPNPTVQEVLCGITFQPSAANDADLLWGRFYEEVRERYPIVNGGMPPVLSIHIGAQGTPQSSFDILQMATPPMVHYRSVKRSMLLQLGPDRLFINALAPYAGWERFSDEIRLAWEALCRIVQPSAIVSLGLRYINRIERNNPDETLGDWLVSNKYVPQVLLDSPEGFGSSRIVIKTEPTERLVVTVGEIQAVEAPAPFVLDIDRASEAVMSTDSEALLRALSRLHEDVWAVFASSKSERLERLLKGEI